MADLDFSAMAEPAGALDFSAHAEPITALGPAESGARALAGSGGVLLDALNGLRGLADPSSTILRAMGAPDETADLANSARDYASIRPNEIPENGLALSARDVGGLPGGALEAVGNLGSMMAALPAAGVAGLGTAAGNALGLTNAEPGDVVNDIASAMTYQPKTQTGQTIAGAAALPFELLAKGGRKAGEFVQDETGSPIAATAVDTAIQALPMLLGVRGKAGAELPRDAVTPEDIAAYMRENPPAPELPPGNPVERAAPRPAAADDITDAEFSDLARLMAPDRVAGELPAPNEPRALPAPTPEAPRMIEGPPQRALPAPAIAVDRLGTARSSADYMTELLDAMRRRDELGITPGTDRAIDAHDLRTARDADLADQRADDAPPWWLAGQMAELDHAAPAPRTPTDLPPPALDLEPVAPQASGDRAATIPSEAGRQWRPTSMRDSKGRPILEPSLDYSRDSLVHWLGKNGGVNFDELAAHSGVDPALLKDADVMRPFGRVGFSALRRKGGMSLEQLRERMQEDGWLPRDDSGTPQIGINEAAHMAMEALNGRPVHHPVEGVDARLAARYETISGDEPMGLHGVHDLEADDYAALAEQHADRAQAAREAIGRDLSPAEEADALSLADLYNHALAVGADPIDVSFAHGATPAETARKLYDLIQQQENGGAQARGNEEAARRGGVGQAEADRAPTGSGEARGVAEGSDEAGRVESPVTRYNAGQGELFARPARPDQRAERSPAPTSADMFGGPSAADHLDAATREKDAQRNGLRGGQENKGDGGLFDGERPEQADIERGGNVEEGAASRDLFTRTRGDLQRHAEDRAQPNPPGVPERAGTAASTTRPSNARPDWTPAVARRGELAVDELVRRFGGSTLADTIAQGFRRAEGAQLVGQVVRTEEDLAAAAYVYRNPSFETLHYVFTDAAGNVLAETAVSSRSPSTSAMFPKGTGTESAIVEWLDGIMPEGTAGVWMTHNHPSGDPTPSRADLSATRQVRDLLKKTKQRPTLHGHVVTNHETYGRITPTGEIRPNASIPRGPDTTRERRGASIYDDPVNSNSSAAVVAKRIAGMLPSNSVAVMTLDAKARISYAAAIPAEALATPRGAALLSMLGKRRGAAGIYLVADSGVISKHFGALQQASKRKLVYNVVELGPDGSARSLVGSHYGSGEVESNIFGAHTRSMRQRQKGGVQLHEETTLGAGDIPHSEREAERPSRRPGESQRDYARRVMRTSKEAIAEATKIAKHQQKVGRANFRAMLAKQARAMDIADAAFHEARVMFDKTPEKINLATIDQWENGQPIGDRDAAQFFSDMKAAFDQRVDRIRELDQSALQSLIENYFPHIWEDSAKAAKWYQGFVAKRPLEGNRSFLKQRTWGTIKEGMASGLKPVSTNPVDLALLKLSQMDKFIAFHEFRDDLKSRGWLKEMPAGERVPEGYARVDDPAFAKAGGLAGYYAVPELIARDINNYLAPSLYRFGAWKSLRAVQNTLMSARLGMSMFHAGFTTLDNLVQHVGVGLQRFADGDIAGGLRMILRDAPLSFIEAPLEGGRLIDEWRGKRDSDPHTAALLNLIEQGGGRWKMSSTEYNQSLPKIIRAVRQRQLKGETVGHALSAVGEASSWIIHHWLVPRQKMAARVMLLKFELDHFAAALGKKRGDYAGIIDAMHPDVAKQLAGKVVDAVDNRLGQMTYDNQFWNKTVREVAQALIGAVGWQVGTVRTVTSGLRDVYKIMKPEELVATLDKKGKITGQKMSRVGGNLLNLISLALIVGGGGAVLQKLLTGKDPEGRDFFFPRTGRRNPDDSEERLQLPTYWMDHYKLATHPLTTASHKIHPSISMLMDLFKNQDYFGTQIRSPDDNLMEQAKDIAEYVALGFVPYSINNQTQLAETDSGAGERLGNFFGVTRAPASVSRSPFQTFVAEKAYNAAPKGARTQEATDRSHMMHGVEDKLRDLIDSRDDWESLDGDDRFSLARKIPEFAALSEQDQRKALKAANMRVPEIRFLRLGIEDKLRAWGMADADERKRYNLRAIILRSDLSRSSVFQRMPEDEKKTIRARIKEIAGADAVIGDED